jgi:hypothetical protein
MHNAPPAPGDEGQGAGHLRASHLWGKCERVEHSSYLLSRLPAGRLLPFSCCLFCLHAGSAACVTFCGQF